VLIVVIHHSFSLTRIYVTISPTYLNSDIMSVFKDENWTIIPSPPIDNNTSVKTVRKTIADWLINRGHRKTSKSPTNWTMKNLRTRNYRRDLLFNQILLMLNIVNNTTKKCVRQCACGPPSEIQFVPIHFLDRFYEQNRTETYLCKWSAEERHHKRCLM